MTINKSASPPRVTPIRIGVRVVGVGSITITITMIITSSTIITTITIITTTTTIVVTDQGQSPHCWCGNWPHTQRMPSDININIHMNININSNDTNNTVHHSSNTQTNNIEDMC